MPPKAFPSLRIRVDKITPNTGFANPYIETFEIGLYFSKILQTELAAADKNARY